MFVRSPLHLLIVLLLLVWHLEASSQRWDLKEWGSHCGTKSPYNKLGDVSSWEKPPGGCKPYHLTLVARHGSRYCCLDDELPALLEFRDANKKLIKKTLRNKWMNKYVLPAPLTRNNQLFKAGMLQHYSIAKRYLAAFPSLLKIRKNQIYDPNVIRATSTQDSRTGISGSSFLHGLFEGLGPLNGFQPYHMPARSTSVDSISHFSDTCDKYNNVDEDEIQVERDAYFQKILPTLIQKLQQGLSEDYLNSPVNISSTDVINLYAGCFTDIYVRSVASEWCSLWTKEMGRMMDYYNDIDFYYDVGPGNAVNGQMASNLVQDIFYHIDQKMSNNEDYFEEKANLYFAHAETVVPLLSLIGFFNSTPPLTRNPPQEYNFKTGKYGCMATHALLVTYDCGKEFRIGFGVNEKQEIFPGCTELFCPYSQVKNVLSSVLNASWPDICDIGSNELSLDVTVENIKQRTFD